MVNNIYTFASKNGLGIELAIKRSRVGLPVWARQRNDTGQIVDHPYQQA